MKRREFIKAAGLAAVAPTAVTARAAESAKPLVGIQIAPVSLLDEGIERCLDSLQEKAPINSLFIYSQTYHAGTKPKNVSRGITESLFVTSSKADCRISG